MSTYVRYVRIRGDRYLAELVMAGVGCDWHPVRKWNLIAEDWKDLYLPKMDPETGWLQSGFSGPVIKVGDSYYAGDYDLRPSKLLQNGLAAWVPREDLKAA